MSHETISAASIIDPRGLRSSIPEHLLARLFAQIPPRTKAKLCLESTVSSVPGDGDLRLGSEAEGTVSVFFRVRANGKESFVQGVLQLRAVAPELPGERKRARGLTSFPVKLAGELEEEEPACEVSSRDPAFVLWFFAVLRRHFPHKLLRDEEEARKLLLDFISRKFGVAKGPTSNTVHSLLQMYGKRVRKGIELPDESVLKIQVAAEVLEVPENPKLIVLFFRTLWKKYPNGEVGQPELGEIRRKVFDRSERGTTTFREALQKLGWLVAVPDAAGRFAAASVEEVKEYFGMEQEDA